MADLGALPIHVSPRTFAQKTGVWWATMGGAPGGAFSGTRAGVARHLPVFFGAAQDTFYYDTHGVVAGTVLVGVSPLANAEVWLFHRVSRQPVGRTQTNAQGEFSFVELCTAADAYFAVAFDPDGGEAFNALIFDKLTPV